MERVITSAKDEYPTFYFNEVDAGLLQHYCGAIPEDFNFGVIVTDELPEGEVAIEGANDMPQDARAGLVRYWESGMAHVHMLNGIDVALAKSLVMPADEFLGDDEMVFESEDGDIDFESEA